MDHRTDRIMIVGDKMNNLARSQLIEDLVSSVLSVILPIHAGEASESGLTFRIWDWLWLLALLLLLYFLFRTSLLSFYSTVLLFNFRILVNFLKKQELRYAKKTGRTQILHLSFGATMGSVFWMGCLAFFFSCSLWNALGEIAPISPTAAVLVLLFAAGFFTGPLAVHKHYKFWNWVLAGGILGLVVLLFLPACNSNRLSDADKGRWHQTGNEIGGWITAVSLVGLMWLGLQVPSLVTALQLSTIMKSR